MNDGDMTYERGIDFLVACELDGNDDGDDIETARSSSKNQMSPQLNYSISKIRTQESILVH